MKTHSWPWIDKRAGLERTFALKSCLRIGILGNILGPYEFRWGTRKIVVPGNSFCMSTFSF